jgi:hypothetical protein
VCWGVGGAGMQANAEGNGADVWRGKAWLVDVERRPVHTHIILLHFCVSFTLWQIFDLQKSWFRIFHGKKIMAQIRQISKGKNNNNNKIIILNILIYTQKSSDFYDKFYYVAKFG